MKLAALPCLLFLLIGSAANSQLSLLPQIGFEQSRTKVQYNNKDIFKPFAEGNIQASLRADYRFKKGHGPFVSIASSPAFRFAFSLFYYNIIITTVFFFGSFFFCC